MAKAQRTLEETEARWDEAKDLVPAELRELVESREEILIPCLMAYLKAQVEILVPCIASDA